MLRGLSRLFREWRQAAEAVPGSNITKCRHHLFTGMGICRQQSLEVNKPETFPSGISQLRIAGSDGVKDSGAKLDDLLLESFPAFPDHLQPAVKQPHYRSFLNPAFDRPVQIAVRS